MGCAPRFFPRRTADRQAAENEPSASEARPISTFVSLSKNMAPFADEANKCVWLCKDDAFLRLKVVEDEKEIARLRAELERTLGIPEGQTTEDMEYSLETVACIGCCGLAPCLTVNDEVSAKLTPKKVRKKFKKARKGPK